MPTAFAISNGYGNKLLIQLIIKFYIYIYGNKDTPLFPGPIGSKNDVQTWLQAMKNRWDWFFDDGTDMPCDICFMDNTNYSGENRLRFRAKDSEYADHYENKHHDFICEYHHIFKQ